MERLPRNLRQVGSNPSAYDVVIIGGGAAGLSGAVALARSRRSVLVIDAGEPRNATAGHVHNFLTRDGTPPADLTAAGRAELIGYGGEIASGRVTRLTSHDQGFTVETADATVTGRRVLLATGSRDELPDIDGLSQRWGRDVLHCAYCHGWEVRDRRVGVLATGAISGHQALLFRQLTPDVVLLTHTGPGPTPDQQEQFDALGVAVVAGRVTAVEAESDGLTGVRLSDGTFVPLDALVVSPLCLARADLLVPLGLEPTKVWRDGSLLGTQVDADPTGATRIPGLWVAGNLADISAQVIGAAAAGLKAGAAINAGLVTDDAAAAVQYEQVYGARAWDQLYRDRHQTWSGQANPVLVTETSHLQPGTALDAGAGEGGDACWLAARGWRVTGVDLSPTALERAAAEAERLGLDIEWRRLDLSTQPLTGTYDLVSSHFLHLPQPARTAAFERLAAAVRPGGTLLIVGHDPSDAHTGVHRPGLREAGWTADELARTLGDGWTIETAEARARPASDHDGRAFTVHDAVLRARRHQT